MDTDATPIDHVTPTDPPRMPPRWVIRSIWALHRALYAVSRGRFGLRAATADHAGYLRLRTVGRRTGRERLSILAYLQDGPDLFTLAMNGWGEREPAWWLNLQAHPDAVVDVPGGQRAVRARAATADERSILWTRLDGGPWGDLDRSAALRPRETAIVILEPRG